MARRFGWPIAARAFVVTAIACTLGGGALGDDPRSASDSDPGARDQARIERLAGLARVWGSIKFFHPYLAYRPIDWDRALVGAIPRVRDADSPAAYRRALDDMLAHLDDGNTRVEPPTPMSGPVEIEETSKANHNSENLEWIDAVDIAETASRDVDRFFEKLNSSVAAAAGADRVVLDLRGSRAAPATDSFALDLVLRRCLSAVLTSGLKSGSWRFRLHNGYAPQVESSSGGYYSALVTTAPRMLAGEAPAGTAKRIAVVVNESTAPIADLLTGLQEVGVAVVIAQGSAKFEPGLAFHALDAGADTHVRMRTTELLNPDGSIGFRPDVVAPFGERELRQRVAAVLDETPRGRRRSRETAASGGLRSEQEEAYEDSSYPDVEHRLLALFRFWNVVEHFFPYRELLDAPWDSVLTRLIPVFESARDEADYQLAILELVAATGDSHGRVQGISEATGERRGGWYPPFNVRYLEGETVVDFLLEEAEGIRLWDRVIRVDGEDIAAFRQRAARYVAASTPQALEPQIHWTLFRGQEGEHLRLTLCGSDGQMREVDVKRSVAGGDARWRQIPSLSNPLPVFGVLPQGFGYVDLTRLQPVDVAAMFRAVGNSPALILDMRGYPHGTVGPIVQRLVDRRRVVGALFSRPFREATGLGETDYALGTAFTFAQPLPAPQGDPYRGKIVVLIDENAGSHAEHSALFLEAAADVTFVGSPTAGANGDVTRTLLPGGLVVSFTGQAVRHGDGRRLQRIGIEPDVRVSQTIRGIREGRDEILEAAIAYLEKW